MADKRTEGGLSGPEGWTESITVWTPEMRALYAQRVRREAARKAAMRDLPPSQRARSLWLRRRAIAEAAGHPTAQGQVVDAGDLTIPAARQQGEAAFIVPIPPPASQAPPEDASGKPMTDRSGKPQNPRHGQKRKSPKGMGY